MSKIMYRGTVFGIEAIEVEKDTAITVTIASTRRREAKDSARHVWRKTFEDAKQALIYNMEIKVDEQQRRLSLQIQTLGRIKAMEEAQ